MPVDPAAAQPFAYSPNEGPAPQQNQRAREARAEFVHDGAGFTKAPQDVVDRTRQVAAGIPADPAGLRQLALVETYRHPGGTFNAFLLAPSAERPGEWSSEFELPDGPYALTTIEQGNDGDFSRKEGKVNKPQLVVAGKVLNAVPEVVITSTTGGVLDPAIEPCYLVLRQQKGEALIVKSAAGAVDPEDLQPGEAALGPVEKASIAVERGSARELAQEALGRQDALAVLTGFAGVSCKTSTNVVADKDDGRITRAGRKEGNGYCIITATTTFHVAVEGGPERMAAYVDYLKAQLVMESPKTGQPAVMSQSELDAAAAAGAKVWTGAPWVYKALLAERAERARQAVKAGEAVLA